MIFRDFWNFICALQKIHVPKKFKPHNLEFLDDFMRIFCTTFSCVRDVFSICERNIFERKRICFVLKNSTNTHLSVFSRIFVASRWCNDFFTKHDLEKYFQKIHDSSGNHDWNVRFCHGNVYARNFRRYQIRRTFSASWNSDNYKFCGLENYFF